jgi:hypothetical protein
VAALETQTIDRLKITDEDDGEVVAERGRVDINGETIKIYNWDTGLGRFKQVDRLTDAKLRTARRGTTHISGVSQYLLRTVRVPRADAVKNLKLEHGKGLPLTIDE